MSQQINGKKSKSLSGKAGGLSDEEEYFEKIKKSKKELAATSLEKAKLVARKKKMDADEKAEEDHSNDVPNCVAGRKEIVAKLSPGWLSDEVKFH